MRVVVAQREGRRLALTLNRPDRYNALSSEMVEALVTELDMARRVQTDLVVLRGAGRSFCSGFDVSDLAEQGDGELLRRFVRIELLLQKVFYAPFITAALCHGPVVGAGADLVCACSHRLAAPETSFRLPGLGFGVVLGTRRLARRVGIDAARRLQASRDWVDARNAARLGLISEIVDTKEWDTRVASLSSEASATNAETRKVFHRALVGSDGERDLADLVRSASRPGLGGRMMDYVEELRRQR